mgnify:CR=1 FL=1
MTQLFDQLDDDLRIPDDHIHFPDPMHLDQISDTRSVDHRCRGGVRRVRSHDRKAAMHVASLSPLHRPECTDPRL